MLDLTLQQILRILAARYKLVLHVLVGTVAATIVVSLLLPPQYSATTTVVVDTKSPDPIASALSSATTSIPNSTLSLATEAEIIASERVARRAVKILRLDENEEVKKLWTDATGGKGALDVWAGELILKKLSVKSTAQSNVLAIKFVGADPDFAAAVANAVAQAYLNVNLELKVDPAKHYAEWFAQQELAQRESLEKAQAAMSKFQQEKGIIAPIEQQDIENTALSEIERQLSAALGESADLLSKQNSGDDVNALPEVMNNSVLTNLKNELSRHQAKLQEAAGNLGRNHPQYQRMESEIEAIRENLRIETGNVIKSFGASLGARSRKVVELRAAYEAQKRKLLRIKYDRDQLALLQGEVETAKKALAAIQGRYEQANLVSQNTQTQVAILSAAVAPLEPSVPKPLLYTLLAIPLGLILGAVAALALEQYDLRIRCAEDLAAMLQAPVLGAVARPGAPRRRFFSWRRPPAMAMK